MNVPKTISIAHISNVILKGCICYYSIEIKLNEIEYNYPKR